MMKTYCQPVFVVPFGHVTSIYLVWFHVRLTFAHLPPSTLNLSDKTKKSGGRHSVVLFFIKVGLGIPRTNADSQWNPVYNAFHRKFCCGNETIRRYFCKRGLDAANLRPALEQSCGKQTLRDRKLFSRANFLYVPNIKMQSRSRSRSVHNFGTCVWRTAAQWQIPIFPASKHFFFPEVATALRFSKRKSRSCAQTLISVSSIFWYWEHIANSPGKIIS